MKMRSSLSLFFCVVLLYVALPKLPLYGEGLERFFSWGWLFFLMLAIAGNLTAVLYGPGVQKGKKKDPEGKKGRTRSFQS